MAAVFGEKSLWTLDTHPTPMPDPNPIPQSPELMTISQTGIDLIKSFEGCSLVAYPDPGTGSDPWTIGYGHTGPNVWKGSTITQAQADQMLLDDLKFYEKAVNAALIVRVTQSQFDALVSLAFNIGRSAFRSSTLLGLLNSGNFDGAAKQFERWNKAGGRVLAGLTKRRQAEADLFLA